MNQVEIPLKLTGIGAIKKELRDLKGQIANATDPEQMTKLAQRAGELADQLKDANEQVAIFNSGSKFEAASNAFGMIKQDLMSLDFQGAADKAKTFKTAMAGIGGKDVSGAFKGLISMVTTLGQTFARFGMMLLTNPIFILVVVITAIVAAVVIFLNKIGVLQKVLEVLMMPINALIKGFQMLTDWMGLTDYAGEKRRENIRKQYEEEREELKKTLDKHKEATRLITRRYDSELEIARATGKGVAQLEKQKLTVLLERLKEEAILEKRKGELALEEIAAQEATYKRLTKAQRYFLQDGTQRIEEANKQNLIQINEQIENYETALKVNAINEDKDRKERNKKAAEDSKRRQKERLDALRQIKDLELSLIKDQTERELEENRIKYQRLIADLKTNEKLTADERKKLKDLYQKIEAKQDAEIQKKAKDEELRRAQEMVDALKEIDNAKLEKKKEAQRLENERQAEALILIDGLNKTQYEKELLELQTQLAERLALVKGNAEQEAKVRADYAKQSRLLEIAEAEKRREAILNLATTTNEGLNQLGQLFINDQKKLEQFQKATALVQIGIDTAKAISSLVAAAQANPFNGVSAGAAGIAQFASGIVQILTNMAKAKQLLTNPTSSPNAGGGGLSGGGSATATAQATPAVNLFGQGNQLNQVGAPTSVETNQNITVQAVVSETDVTTTQTKIDKIKKNAEL